MSVSFGVAAGVFDCSAALPPFGRTLKPSFVLVPADVVTPIDPDRAPGGTAAVTFVSSTVAGLASAPPKVTLVAPARLLPVIVTIWPRAAEAGLKESDRKS